MNLKAKRNKKTKWHTRDANPQPWRSNTHEPRGQTAQQAAKPTNNKRYPAV